MDTKNITLLCKVVDNFGDIGFVYRLARALTELDSSLRLRLVVSDIASFAALCPLVDATKTEQTCYGWQIFDWNAENVCTRAFTADPPAIILECFQCGRPDWLDALLFDGDRADGQHMHADKDDAVHIINIDYLTAEPYADEFHLLKSGTRSARVKKINFMPGFTDKTGGLLLDRAFMQSRKTAYAQQTAYNAQQTVASGADDRTFTATFFSYERDCAPVVQGLTAFQTRSGRAVRVLVAAGKSHAPFMQAWERAGKPFAVQALPFLPQEEWDALLCAADWNFVRGEDSMSRVCLAGVPFVWQAYPQDEDYHVVKLAALNDRLRAYIPASIAPAYDDYTRAYNTGKDTAAALAHLLMHADTLHAGFLRFSDALIANGNLAQHILDWVAKLLLV